MIHLAYKFYPYNTVTETPPCTDTETRTDTETYTDTETPLLYVYRDGLGIGTTGTETPVYIVLWSKIKFKSFCNVVPTYNDIFDTVTFQ